ncbi:reverse transcriptase domain-containing protein [Tanacetum coccineum]|uniref:Reverse transcriptase domain-containing protein n=1 Tax=Tanacetum coccineum TaxID=301880 RepID=A0ABQ5CCA3_9ASTR
MLKSLLSNKEKLIELANTPVSENCSAVILKKLPEKLGDPGKFLIPCGFNELKCKALADLGASINLMPLSVWKELGLPKLISTQMTLELANRDICTPKGIARDVFVPVGKFTFPADFVIVDYESDPRVPLILGRPFLRTARALIDVHGEEMILRDGNERLILNMRNDTSSYSNEPHQESINMIDVYNVSHEEIREDLFATNHPSGNPTSSLTSHTNLTSPEVNDDIFDPEEDIIENLLNLDKTKDLPPYHDNQSSGNPTPISEPETKSSSSSPTLISLEESDLIWEEFEAYLASDSFPPGNSNPSSLLPPFHNSLSGSTTSSSHSLYISETSDYFLEEFADELAHITFPPGNDDLPFDAESDLLELEYLLNHDPIKDMDSILEDSVDENSLDDNLDDTISEMFTDEHALDYSSPPLWDDYDDNLFDHETDNDNVYDDPFDFKEEKIKESKLLIDELDLPESNNVLPFPEYDSIFYEDFSEVEALSSTNNEDKATNASLILEDFNPPLYELPFHKEVPGLGALLSFSSENEEKVFNPGILTSKRVHTSLLPELSHRGTAAFKKEDSNSETASSSNKAKFEKEIYVLETMNIELEHSVATLRKENETLKQHYKDLYDSIKITRSKTTEQTSSLLANNADLKAQIQEKVFAIAALKNNLRKLKGNSVDTKFDKTSVLGKPVLPSLRNQSVVRQPNAFKSERAQMSKQRFASQVDVNKNLSKPVTQHYLPKKTESTFAKPDHMIASSSSRNSSKNMPRSVQ